VGDLPAFGFFRQPRGVPRRLSVAYQFVKFDTSSYHADIRKGHGTVGEWQRCGMACVN
jgi:hypothetical protein